MNNNSSYIFKHAVKSQRALIHQWLQQNHIREWVHGQGLENTLNGLEKFFQYQAENKKLDRQSDITHHWIAYDNDKPFAYLLTSNILNSANEYSKYREEQGFAITLDIFICDKNYLGKGLACTIIKQFLLKHFSGITEVFIDPEKTNAKAVHVYQKVGFHIVGEFIAAWHPVPHYMMKLRLNDLSK